jgi:hypothetical protein
MDTNRNNPHTPEPGNREHRLQSPSPQDPPPVPEGMSKPEPRLDPALLAELDALLESRSEKTYTPAGLRLTSNNSLDIQANAAPSPELARLLGLLDQLPVESPSNDLIARTLNRIEAQENLEHAHIRTEGGFTAFAGLRIHEVATVAAVLLFSVSLIWPALSYVRQDARRLACANNLSITAAGFAHYAADNNDRLPNRGAMAGATWWNVGKSCAATGECKESNSAHLYHLARSGYVDARTLNCPENHDAPSKPDPAAQDWNDARAVSYSYQNQYAKHQPRLSQTSQMAILADKNPLFVARGDGKAGLKQANLPAVAPSKMHRSSGQNVLRSDGSVIWSNSPVLDNGDNIWLASGINEYRGVESPSTVTDSFLVP